MPGPDAVISRLDAAVGDGVEAAVRLKHRRRLRRLGQLAALEPREDGPWASGDPPPRDGCRLDVLIDGEHAFPAIAAAIEGARESVHITGWHVDPAFDLVRGAHGRSVRNVLAEAAERVDVRVLVWAGAPVPAFHPTRRQVAEAVRELTRGTRIRCEPDPREHPFHCHHEKTAIIDGHVAFVGGIDMTGFAGDRFDSTRHPARGRLGWHDVGTRLTGPVVADVHDHFALRWRELTGEELARPSGALETADAALETADGGTSVSHTVQMVRTVAEGMYDALPRGAFGILESYVRALRSAREIVYLENQFLWSPEIVAILAGKLRQPPSDDFRLVIVLPSRANNGQDDTSGQLGVLAEADGGAGRFLGVTLRSLTGEHDERLYVHAKVGIVDDQWLTVGSANLNAHSLLNDTEVNVVTADPGLARDTRLRLWSEHLQVDAADLAAESPRRTVDERWRPIAAEQLSRLRGGAPATHRLLELPGVSRRARRLLGPLVGLLDDG